MNEAQKDLLIGLVVFALDIVLLYYLWQNNVALTAVLICVSALILLYWTNKEEKILYFTGLILGPIYDLVLVPTGIWAYGKSNNIWSSVLASFCIWYFDSSSY